MQGNLGGDLEMSIGGESFGNSSHVPSPTQASTAPAAANTAPPLETLDEPVSTTILRDLRQIGQKIGYVLMPRRTDNSMSELRNWDLWGPLLLCMALAVTLSWNNKDPSLVFAGVFFIVWVGAAVVTINAVLLGGKISFFQSVCVLGYCLAPLNIASLVTTIYGNIIFRLVITTVCYAWATRASVGFMSQLVPADRRFLGVYPVVLFYFVIAWMILVG